VDEAGVGFCGVGSLSAFASGTKIPDDGVDVEK
jgi:hypothetical protein